jgi:uncharacterized repeat protein (TIGR02543 family)
MIFNRTGGGGSSKPVSMSFDSPYGTEPESIYATFSKPEDPSQTGYEFDGWYTDTSYDEQYDWSSPASNGTVYAKWSIESPDVSSSSGLTYNGDEQILGTVSAKGVGQTVEYRVGGGEWSEIAPKAINAGSYTVYWRVTADMCETVEGSFRVSIAKASCQLSIDPTSLTIKDGEGDGTIKVTRVGGGTISASVSPEGFCSIELSGNVITVSYIASGSATVSVSVAETDNYLSGSDSCSVKMQPSLDIVSWESGTDKQIADMVAAADAGQINLSDYWHVGDTRTVNLSAMDATGVGEAHASQNVQFVLTDPGHYNLSTGKPCNFVVLQKDCLNETGYINSSSTTMGGWNECQRRTWCNYVYFYAIPITLRGIFKQFTTYSGNGGGPSSVASTDFFALFSEKEVFGSTTYSNSSAESDNSQLTWFKTSSNRIKKVNGTESGWWERSPYNTSSSMFCSVSSNGNADWGGASYSVGIAPFGCI